MTMIGRWTAPLVAIALLGPAFSGRVSSQAQTPAADDADRESAALRRQVQALIIGQAAIQKQLEEIRSLLRATEPPQARRAPVGSVDVAVETAGAPAKGSATATITVVEFSDFECPFCGRYVRETLATLDREYIQTGKVRYVFRNFPLESIHPHAFKAGIASLCALQEGKYWQMHDRLFANQTALDADALAGHGRALNLTPSTYDPCLAGDGPASRVRQDQADGKRAGVDSTPTFLIGRTAPGETALRAVRIIRGAQPYAAFKAEIEALLAGG